MLFNEPKLLKSALVVQNPKHPRDVSVLFNEPKLLKSERRDACQQRGESFSALQRAEIAEMASSNMSMIRRIRVSVLFNEPKLLKSFVSSLSPQQQIRFQCSSTSRNC